MTQILTMESNRDLGCGEPIEIREKYFHGLFLTKVVICKEVHLLP